MGQMTSTDPRVRRMRRGAVLAVVIGAILALFALLFLLENDAWVQIRIPGLPWSAESTVAGFEARLWGIIAAAFAAGVAIAVVAWRLFTADQRALVRRERDRREKAEAELDKLSKLLASSKDRS